MTILLKTLRASWLTILLWCAGIFALNLLLVQAFPVVKSLFENPAEPLPALLNHWLGSGTAWESLSGFISTILISQVSIVIVIFAIIFSLSIFAREERNGLMQTQLAKSISRKTYFWQKYFALVFTLILLSASYYAGIFVGTIILGDTSVGLADLWQPAISTFLLTLSMASIAFSLAAIFPNRTFAGIFTISLGIIGFSLSTLANSSGIVQTLSYFTPFHYQNTPSVIEHGLNIPNVIILSATIIIPIFFATFIFSRRDLRITNAVINR